MRLIAGVTAAGLGGLAASATAQPIGGAGARGPDPHPPYPPLKWVKTEELDAHTDAHGQAADMVYWEEVGLPSSHWIYVTGWLTEIEDDAVVGTRMATFKYDATHPGPSAPPAQASAYFPRLDDPLPLIEGEEFKAVAMAVDDSNGDVYIAGHGPRLATGRTTDRNYVVIKYDEDLNFIWANYYDGPVSGGDTAADIALGGSPAEVVIVTGTSMGPADPPKNTQQDIATFAWEAGGAIASTYWPDIGWGAGCRRFDAEGGDDIAVGIGHVQVSAEAPLEQFLSVVVGGTAWREETQRNFTVHHWYGPATGNDWEIGYDGGNGGDDVMTAISPGLPVYVAGYSENPTTGDYDFAAQGYGWDSVGPWSLWTPALRKDFNQGDDIPLDLVVFRGSPCAFSVPDWHIWLTGAAESGSRLDAATVYYHWSCSSGNPTESWSDSWSLGHDFSYGHALAATSNEAYIAGSVGYNNVWEAVLGLKYEREFLPPPLFGEDWSRTYHAGGALTGLPGSDHEGGKIVVKDVNPGPGGPSVFMAGVSTVSSKGSSRPGDSRKMIDPRRRGAAARRRSLQYERVEGGAMMRIMTWSSAAMALSLAPSHLDAQCEPVWSSLGGLDGRGPTSLAVYDEDGHSPRAPVLFIDGGLEDITTIARWDGWRASIVGDEPHVHQHDGLEELMALPEPAGKLPAGLYAGGNMSVAGGVPVTNLARWADGAWHDVGGGVTQPGIIAPHVFAMQVFDEDGEGPLPPALFVGGKFAAAGGVPVDGLARWDGERWTEVGGGLLDPAGPGRVTVNAMTVFDDGRGPALYVAGSFSSAGGKECWNIARWDGAEWEPVGPGINNTVRSLCVFDDDGAGPNPPALFAGGGFHEARGDEPYSMRHIGRWDGAEWKDVGWVSGGTIDAMTVWDPDGAGPEPENLFVGGIFNILPDLSPVNNIARYDGERWRPLAGGVTGAGPGTGVKALAAFDEDGPGPNPGGLYVGGVFYRAGAVESKHIARWGCPLPATPCYADCDGDGQLAFFDFLCFQNQFAAGDTLADCDYNGDLDFFDFLCFQNAFAAGCP